MSKHTLGPWTVDANQNITAAGGMVAITGIVDGDKEAANALLISAAPELLHALNLAVMALENSQPVRDSNHEERVFHKRTEKIARAAIAKATGAA